MLRRFFAAAIFSIAIAPASDAAAVPPELKEKSVLLSWTDSREQKNGSAGDYRNVNVAMNASIYISSAGRLFVRLSAQGRSGSGATNEQVGETGKSLGNGVRSVRYEGRSIAWQAAFGNFARSIKVDFDNSFASCTASQTIGKQEGSRPTEFKNVAGHVMEIRSMTASAPSCSIRNGNVFQ